MLYEGIYQACSLKEEEIKDIAKILPQDSGGCISIIIVLVLLSSERRARETTLFNCFLYCPQGRERDYVCIIVV